MRHDAGMDAPHHDVDILLGEQTLSKSGQLSVDLPLLLIATLCLLLLRPKRRESFVLLVATDHRAPSHLRPPSCAPPSLFSQCRNAPSGRREPAIGLRRQASTSTRSRRVASGEIH